MKEVTNMERVIPKPGEKFLDTDKKPYQILCVANGVETKEKMLVYQALYGEFECFVRPLGMFMEEAASKKQQEKETLKTADVKEELPKREAVTYENNQADPALLQFLDADTLEEKYQVIKSLGNSITNRLIDDFAVTLDLVIPDGEVDIRYQQLLSSVRTLQKFETTRFRRR